MTDRERRGGGLGALAPLRDAAVAGIAGSVAMVPFGLVIRRMLGLPLNRYGELVLRLLVGRATPLGLAAEHLLIGWAMALPLVALRRRAWVARPAVAGAAYGAAIWLVVNSLALPLAFAQPTPWSQGPSAIWPSLLVHMVYGVVAAKVLARLQGVPPGTPHRTEPYDAADDLGPTR